MKKSSVRSGRYSLSSRMQACIPHNKGGPHRRRRIPCDCRETITTSCHTRSTCTSHAPSPTACAPVTNISTHSLPFAPLNMLSGATRLHTPPFSLELNRSFESIQEVPGGRKNLKGGGVWNVNRAYDRIWIEGWKGSGATSTRSVKVNSVGLAVVAEEGEAGRLTAVLDLVPDISAGFISLQHEFCCCVQTIGHSAHRQ